MIYANYMLHLLMVIIIGDHLRICQQGLACCTPAMEHKMSHHSKAEFDSLLKEAIADVKNVLGTRTQKFDEFFRELLKSSKQDFHQMFLQTYGLLYERHSSIFTDMFQDLERYYMTGGVDLSDAMDTFFHRLYQKMFQVLNSQYKFDDKYLSCISEHMDELKPFGDVPKKLTVEVKRSFIATRTFVQALSNGKEVIKNMEIPTSLECSTALMKMTLCPQCLGLPDLKPCGNYCISVMRGCLAYHTELDKEWNNYIDALLSLASRLETSFNIESVVDPIDIKISEAIMNFQENGAPVSQKLFEACGKPRMEAKRETRNVTNFDHKITYQTYAANPTTATGMSMERLIQDIKKKIKRTKGFWTKLPQTLCSNQHVAGPTVNPDVRECWNGSGKAVYEMDSNGEEINQKLNPEMNLDATRHNAIINQQILTLKLITTKLNHAYNGLDVEWQDSADSTDDMEGSGGSGSGSGDGLDDSDSPHIKDPTDDIYFSGSTPQTPNWVDEDLSSVRSRPKSHRPNLPSTRDASTIILVPSTLLWTLLLLSSVHYALS